MKVKTPKTETIARQLNQLVDLKKAHPEVYRLLMLTMNEKPELIEKLKTLTPRHRKILVGLITGMIIESRPDLDLSRADHGTGHPHLRRNDHFLCLIPEYRPPNGIGVGIGVRCGDGSWNVEYGHSLTTQEIMKRFPNTQFFTWDAVISKLWLNR